MKILISGQNFGIFASPTKGMDTFLFEMSMKWLFTFKNFRNVYWHGKTHSAMLFFCQSSFHFDFHFSSLESRMPNHTSQHCLSKNVFILPIIFSLLLFFSLQLLLIYIDCVPHQRLSFPHDKCLFLIHLSRKVSPPSISLLSPSFVPTPFPLLYHKVSANGANCVPKTSTTLEW